MNGLTNAFIAFPLVGMSVASYVHGLRGLKYGSDAYRRKASKIHRKVAKRISFLSNRCGGIYFKAGSYIGTLDRIMPREFVEKL